MQTPLYGLMSFRDVRIYPRGQRKSKWALKSIEYSYHTEITSSETIPLLSARNNFCYEHLK